MSPRRCKPGAVYPIRILLGPVLPEELSRSEEGAYEDEVQLAPLERTRPLHRHTYLIARRFSTQLRIDTVYEAEDVYYAVCSGTFKLRHYKAACKIADALREVVRAHNPDLVDKRPRPERE